MLKTISLGAVLLLSLGCVAPVDLTQYTIQKYDQDKLRNDQVQICTVANRDLALKWFKIEDGKFVFTPQEKPEDEEEAKDFQEVGPITLAKWIGLCLNRDKQHTVLHDEKGEVVGQFTRDIYKTPLRS